MSPISPGNVANESSEIKAAAAKQFDLLPAHLKLECSLQKCTDSSFERDFLAAVRLNHLHVMFMLSLLQLRTPAEPDTSTVEIAEEIISLIVDLILLRDQIVNSGTSLVWKVHTRSPALEHGSVALNKHTDNVLRPPSSRNPPSRSPQPAHLTDSTTPHGSQSPTTSHDSCRGAPSRVNYSTLSTQLRAHIQGHADYPEFSRLRRCRCDAGRARISQWDDG
jgi:hypothetical protein